MSAKILLTFSKAVTGLLSVYMVAFGIVYATRSEPMPHHAAALGEAMTPEALALYLTLMRLAGVALSLFGLCSLFVVLGTKAKTRLRPCTVVSVLLLALFSVITWVAFGLEVGSGAQTHWEIMIGLAIVAAVSAVASAFGSKVPDKT